MKIFELVVPAFNEEASLERLVHTVRNVALKFNLSPETFRLVLVNNGSTDGSSRTLMRLQEHQDLVNWFCVITIDKNRGYGHGLYSGLLETSARIVGWTHADFNYDIEDAFLAYQILQNQPEMKFVKGVRNGRPRKDIFVSRVFDFCAQFLLGIKVHEINAQPKVFDSKLLNYLKNPPKSFGFDLYVIYVALKIGFKFKTLPVLFKLRQNGVSSWNTSLFSIFRTVLSYLLYIFQLRAQEGFIKRLESES